MPPSQKPLALQWNQLTLDAIKYSNTSPPLAARARAMVHTAMFDAWSVYSKCAISTTTARYIKRHNQGCGEDEIHKTFSYAAYRVLTDLFWIALQPDKRNMFRELMLKYNYYPDDCLLNSTTASGIGNLIARLVLDYRHGDESNPNGLLFHIAPWNDFTGYQPVNPAEPSPIKDINRWQPLLVNEKIQKFLVAHWGLVKPFALEYGNQFRPGPPYNYKDFPVEFKKQALEIILISESLTDKQKAIAEYWCDGPETYTPPGHWCEIAQFIAERENYNDADCIKLFFALSNALLDTSIACWECKHYYDSVRPITAVHELFRGRRISAWGGPFKGTVDMDGKDWILYQHRDFITPSFPEHVSSVSSFASAAATAIQKGGSGKTTTAINLGAALQLSGKKVLLIDADPQANLSQSLGINDDPENNLYTEIQKEITGKGSDIKKAIVQLGTGLSFVPSSFELATAEMELISVYDREKVFKWMLEPVINEYDFIIIDCPHSNGMLTQNSLVSSDYILIPLQAEFLPLKGVYSLLQLFDAIKKKQNIKLNLLGFVLTKYDNRKIMNRQVKQKLENEFENKVFKTHIRTSIELAKAQEAGKDIFSFNNNSNAARDYKELQEELIEKLNS